MVFNLNSSVCFGSSIIVTKVMISYLVSGTLVISKYC